MRVAIVTESFPPDVNGVAHCALQTARHLMRRGHDTLVIAPTGPAAPGDDPCPVVRVPSVPLPGYRQVRVALPSRRLAAALAAHRAELVHLAAPFVLGVRGMAAAARLGIPAVAVYQTDLGTYARTYLGTATAAALAWRRLTTVHGAADRTLAPSPAAVRDLAAHGVERIRLWARGVDAQRFHPRRRDERLRRELAPGGELLVGYVGRLAPEKHVELLGATAAEPGIRVVVTGDGPSEPALRAALPGARFTGRRTGDELARLFASLDVFVHTGPYETFCQTVQEAMASGVPVVAPAAGGPLDLVGHERTGLLVPPHDPLAVRQAVRRLAEPALRERYGRAGRAAVERRSWERIGDELLGHYAEVLDARAAARLEAAARPGRGTARLRRRARTLPPAVPPTAAPGAVPGGLYDALPTAGPDDAGRPAPGAAPTAVPAASPAASPAAVSDAVSDAAPGGSGRWPGRTADRVLRGCGRHAVYGRGAR